MEQFPEYILEAKKDFDLFYQNPEKYRQNVINLSKKLCLFDDNKLQENFLPGYLAGNYKNGSKYLFIGINPGFNKKQNIVEEQLKNETWEKYHNFILNFFDIFADAGFKSPYFTRLYNLIAGFENDKTFLTQRTDKIKYMQNKVITMELIPYHSSRFNANIEDPLVIGFLKERINISWEFIKELPQTPKLIIFNGGPFKKLLIDNNLWQNPLWQRVPFKWTTSSGVNNTLDIYLTKKDNLNCIIFSIFLMSARGLTNNHLADDIPNLLREYLEI